MNHRLMVLVVATVALASVIDGCGPRPRLSGTIPSDERIAGATTKAEHEALAGDYAKLATEARSKAELHTKMGERYRHQHFGPAAGKGLAHANAMAAHCKTVAKLYSSLAAEYDEMAKRHRAMAAEVP